MTGLMTIVHEQFRLSLTQSTIGLAIPLIDRVIAKVAKVPG